MFNNFPHSTPPPVLENRAVYEIMWKNTVQPYRPQMTIWRMRIACCIPKATNTHSEYVTLITLPRKNLYANTLHSYVIGALFVL